MNATQVFLCRPSRTVIVVTIITLIGFFIAFYLAYSNEFPLSVQILLGAIPAALSVLCASYYPLRIEVDDSYLSIICVGLKKRIPRSELLFIDTIQPKNAIRLWGSGMFFGYLWWFRASNIGYYFSISNNWDEQILIRTPRRNYVISCERKEELVKLVSP